MFVVPGILFANHSLIRSPNRIRCVFVHKVWREPFGPPSTPHPPLLLQGLTDLFGLRNVSVGNEDQYCS